MCNIANNLAVTVVSTGNINVSLETVFEFNRKDKTNDLRILDDVQNFIDKVRNELLYGPEGKKNKQKGRLEVENDLRENGEERKVGTRKSLLMVKTKSSPMIIMLNKLKKDGRREEKPPRKSLFNLLATIIRSLKDDDIKIAIDFAHNKAKKLRGIALRRAMNKGLDMLKETPVNSIREFLRTISTDAGEKTSINAHHKLNKSFENFFLELQWLMSQMDPETTSLLTLLFNDLEKVFKKELEKSRLKIMTDTNRDLFHKLRRNPYILGSDEDGLLNIVKDSMKSLIYDNYGSLNENKNLMRAKLKPFWENMRKFFDHKKRDVKSKGLTKDIKGWDEWRLKQKNVDSSFSMEDSNRSLVTVALKIENDDNNTDIVKLYTKTNRKNTTNPASKAFRFTVKTRERISSDVTEEMKNPSRTTTLYFSALNDNSQRNRSMNISRLTSLVMDQVPKNLSIKRGYGTDAIDEFDKANKQYHDSHNSSLPHRFRVQYKTGEAVTTRKNLKYKTTRQASVAIKRYSSIYSHNNKDNKTGKAHIELNLRGFNYSYVGQKPSRTTFRVTPPIKLINASIGKVENNVFRGHKTSKVLKDSFEEDSFEDKSIDSHFTNKIPQSLIKRIDNIEEKIQKIENIIHTKKTTNWFSDLNLNIEKDVTTKAKATTKATSTTKIYMKNNINESDEIDNEIIELPKARAVLNDFTSSSINSKPPGKTTVVALSTATVLLSPTGKIQTNNKSKDKYITLFSKTTVPNRNSTISNQTTASTEWIIKI